MTPRDLPALWGESLATSVALSAAIASATFEMTAEAVSIAAPGERRSDSEVVAAEVRGTEKVILVDARELAAPDEATRGIVSDAAVDVEAMR